MNKHTLNTKDYLYEDLRRLDAALAEHLFGYKWCQYNNETEYILEDYFANELCNKEGFWSLSTGESKNVNIDGKQKVDTDPMAVSDYAPDKWHNWHMPVIFEMGSLGYNMDMSYSPVLQQEIGEGFQAIFQKDPDVNVRDYGTCKSNSDSVAICQAALTALGVESPFIED